MARKKPHITPPKKINYKIISREDTHEEERASRICSKCKSNLIIVDDFLYCSKCKNSFTIKPIFVKVRI